ncbi:MAG: HepT-like ribonuclease domain-containing protein [Thermoanaerobaculia bacterium]
MRPEDRDAAYLWDMRDAARMARDLIAGMSLEAFLEDRRTQLAVERVLELVGEAARRVSIGLRDAHPELPWRSIVGLRNILVHDYGEIDAARLFAVAVRDIPVLLAVLEPLLPPEP